MRDWIGFASEGFHKREGLDCSPENSQAYVSAYFFTNSSIMKKV